MAHYAFLDENNVVTEVIVGREENDLPHDVTDWEIYYAEVKGQVCKRTSFNTSGGRHMNGGTPFRKNFASVGYSYDETLDAFIPPQPFPSWILDNTSCTWKSPTPYPNDDNIYGWNEDNGEWELRSH